MTDAWHEQRKSSPTRSSMHTNIYRNNVSKVDGCPAREQGKVSLLNLLCTRTYIGKLSAELTDAQRTSWGNPLLDLKFYTNDITQ